MDSGSPSQPREPPLGPLDILPKLLPELSVALAAVALQLWPERVGPWVRDGLTFIAFTEVTFAMFQATLTDISTRLRRRPPWWALAGIALGLLLLYPEAIKMASAAFREGWPVFLPFAWSLLERLRELWTLPGAPRLEKLRRRALVSGRLAIPLLTAGAALAAAGMTSLLDLQPGGFDFLGATAGWWLAAAFALAAFDVVRVHLPGFADRPRALVTSLDAMHLDSPSPLDPL